eukprot:Awhi_evm1s2995
MFHSKCLNRLLFELQKVYFKTSLCLSVSLTLFKTSSSHLLCTNSLYTFFYTSRIKVSNTLLEPLRLVVNLLDKIQNCLNHSIIRHLMTFPIQFNFNILIWDTNVNNPQSRKTTLANRFIIALDYPLSYLPLNSFKLHQQNFEPSRPSAPPAAPQEIVPQAPSSSIHPSRVNNVNIGNVGSNVQCYNCGMSGHKSYECSSNGSNSMIQCYSCGKMGLKSNQCYRVNGCNNANYNAIQCYKCGRFGHKVTNV